MSNFTNPNSFTKDKKWSRTVKTASGFKVRLCFCQLFSKLYQCHIAVWVSPRGYRVRPVSGRTRVWSLRQPSVLVRDAEPLCHCASCRCGWVRRLNGRRTTRRIINKWCMKNYSYPRQPVRCVAVGRKLSVWFHFGFVGHNFMLLRFLMSRDVWFD